MHPKAQFPFALRPEDLVPEGSRALVVTPCPDVEILAIGGLLGQLARAGRPIAVVVVTDACPGASSGEPDPREISQNRFDSEVALTALGVSALSVHLGLRPGHVTAATEELSHSLCALLLPGDVVFTTVHALGGPDHDATVVAARRASAMLGLDIYESVAGASARRQPANSNLAVLLDARMRERKQAALTGMTGIAPCVEPVELLAA